MSDQPFQIPITKPHRMLPFEHPLRVRRRKLEERLRRYDLANNSNGISAYLVRASFPYVLFVMAVLGFFETSTNGHETRFLSVSLGIWIVIDISIRTSERQLRKTKAEFRLVEEEIDVELRKMNIEPSSIGKP